jgi:hypothetical protein
VWWHTLAIPTLDGEAEAGGHQVQGQCGLHNETLSQKKQNNKRVSEHCQSSRQHSGGLLKSFTFLWFGAFLFILQYWGLNSGSTLWATPPSSVLCGFFQGRVSRTICPGWLGTSILLISASWAARIIGVRHIFHAVKHTQNKNYHFTHLKVWSSVTWTTSALCALTATIQLQNLLLLPLSTNYWIPISQPWGTTGWLAGSKSLATLSGIT